MKVIEYEEIKLLKQSEKSTVLLVREAGGERVLVKKSLKGQHPIYSKLKSCSHPFLPRLYEVVLSDEDTTIFEEYVEGQSIGSAQLSEKQTVTAAKELCSVLEFLHGKDIIHRDIKPSNIILAADGHIRLIDFDAARMPRADLEQDTRLLGTRGYAPPEQYGFAQTDARTDIYSLGVTLEQLFGKRAHKLRYRRIIGKCTNLDPDKRYQSARQVKRAFSAGKRCALYSLIIIALAAALWYTVPLALPERQNGAGAVSAAGGVTPVALPAPENPHWNGETGIAVFGNVPDSGGEGEVIYRLRLYRMDTKTPPDLDKAEWDGENSIGGAWEKQITAPTYEVNLSTGLKNNGFYYFAVSAIGDGVNFSDSPYVLSNAFEYTGEAAPPLQMPTGLTWKVVEDDGPKRFATWSNLESYEDKDSFSVRFYDQHGIMIVKNIWTKEDIHFIGHGGVWFNTKAFAKAGSAYRFTVQVETSRPNEYQSSYMPDPVPEEYFSPWYILPQES